MLLLAQQSQQQITQLRDQIAQLQGAAPPQQHQVPQEPSPHPDPHPHPPLNFVLRDPKRLIFFFKAMRLEIG
jgi:hypothetical protein